MDVDGIILILSCSKHKNTRLIKYGPKQKEYNNWKVITVIGNLFLEKEYIFDNNLLLIKCEDSYIHLLKKLVLSIKYLHQIFNIKYGILRCGDDLIFNEDKLLEFINSEKYDFYGQASKNENYTSTDISLLKEVAYDPFMYKYYLSHQSELQDREHGIHMSIDKLNSYLVRPRVWGPHGIIYYLSNYSCNILINTMEKINYNIFHCDEFTNSYPYTIEDVGVTYIMYYNKVPFINKKIFFDTPNSITKHTNEYK